MTTHHYERSYATARAVFAFEEFVGWTIAFIGVLFVLAIFFAGGLDTPFSSMEAFKAHASSASIELITIIVGVIAVANAQTNRAIVDNAELTREILAITRRAASGSGDKDAKRRVEPLISIPSANNPGTAGSDS